MVWVVLFYGSSRTAFTFFPIHSLGTSILADVAQGLTIFGSVRHWFMLLGSD